MLHDQDQCFLRKKFSTEKKIQNMRQIVHCLVKTDIFPRFFNFSTLCRSYTFLQSFVFGLFITIFLVPYHEKVIALSTAISCPNSGNAILEKLGSIAMTKLPSFHVKRLFTRTRTTTTTTKKFNNFASTTWREVFQEPPIPPLCFACQLPTKVNMQQ